MEKVVTRTKTVKAAQVVRSVPLVAPPLRQETPMKRALSGTSISDQVRKIQRVFNNIEAKRRALDHEIQKSNDKLSKVESLTTDEVKRNAKIASRNGQYGHVLEKLRGHIDSLANDKVTRLKQYYTKSIEVHHDTVDLVCIMESDLQIFRTSSKLSSTGINDLRQRLDHYEKESLDMEANYELNKELLIEVNEECESLKLRHESGINNKNKLTSSHSQEQSEVDAEKKLLQEINDKLAHGTSLVKGLKAKNDSARLFLDAEETSLQEQIKQFSDEIIGLNAELSDIGYNISAMQTKNVNLEHRSLDLIKHFDELQRRGEDQSTRKCHLLEEKNFLEVESIDINKRTEEEKDVLEALKADKLVMAKETTEMDRKILCEKTKLNEAVAAHNELQDEQQCLYVALQESKEKLQFIEKEQNRKLSQLSDDYDIVTAKNAKEQKQLDELNREIDEKKQVMQELEREYSALEDRFLQHEEQIEIIRVQNQFSEVARLETIEKSQNNLKANMEGELLNMQQDLNKIEEENQEPKFQGDLKNPRRGSLDLDDLLLCLGSRERIEFEKYLKQKIFEQLRTIKSNFDLEKKPMIEALEDMRSGRRIEIAKNRASKMLTGSESIVPIVPVAESIPLPQESMQSEMKHQYSTVHFSATSRKSKNVKKSSLPSPLAGSPCDWFDDSEMW